MKNKSQNIKLYGVVIFFVIICLYGIAIGHGWKAPTDASKIKNPIELNQEALQKGQELYSNLCSYCHGKNAEGGAALNLDIQPIPPDLKKRLNSHSDGDFFWKIKNGKGEMLAFEEELEDKQVWQTILFIHSLIEK
ncbi:MAG: c-type cytochrome [Desulfobacula sp.]|nr:c-type cytochrome [Desulfobacula sp.]